MAEDFEAAVEQGLRLSKRVYYGKNRAVAPPKTPSDMDRCAGDSYLPTCPMLYAVIADPAIVDNPDMPSYQPYVHGRCDPPALIPLQMNGVSLVVDCYLETAFVTVSATWRVHCVMGSRSCDCRLVVPMGEQGSVLNVDVEVPMKSYSTQLTTTDNEIGDENAAKIAFLKPHIFDLTIPKIDGGTNISVKIKWSQKLVYRAGQFTLNIPFNFPGYVIPAGTKIPKHEKIELNVNSGPGTDILRKTMSHPLKEQFVRAGELSFLYNSDVHSWSSRDFVFTYRLSSTDHINGTVFLNPPLLQDVDRRHVFCCYLFPGKKQSEKVFRREVVYVVDISGSMRGEPIEDTKKALLSELANLDPQDLFNVIAFNEETYSFSSSLKQATSASIESATQWVASNFVANGGTNILLPLNQAIEMLSDTHKNSIPIIFLITDGAVENERHICDTMKTQLTNRNRKSLSPRIYTLGIGTFCNHYFLRKLATLSGGVHEAATDVQSIELRMGKLFARASSILLANIVFENLDEVDDLEVYPRRISDLSSESPLTVWSRYRGEFPTTLKVKGTLPDMSSFSLNLKAQNAKEIPLHKMLAKQEIDILTTEAWYSDNKQLKEKIENMSVQNGTISEYTHKILLETERIKTTADSDTVRKVSTKKVDTRKTQDSKHPRIIARDNNGVGFGNLSATKENVPPGPTNPNPGDAAEVFVRGASSCYSKLCNDCCGCMCFIQTCSKINDQAAILLTQLCASLACLGCYACCCSGDG
ncbi:hypothetical protein ABFS82_12G129700 [Erythranthe guttata]|uniref:uncharacterized protein LOC105968161 n=1 Tax=Erythranthe guttata TaxID=4155 RepID=UPI00064D7B49|nr:PREDICTED: uncharacterized protein LOC105968161 [Erythranthe guttata]|eukprot:XP_012848237.1 PREDICTED: uncharacterized protein LOC105968161 [Erythranthe guttata]